MLFGHIGEFVMIVLLVYLTWWMVELLLIFAG